MRKRIALVAMVFFLAGAGRATAQDSGFGLGVIIGEPTGLSMKFWQSRSTALDLAAAWSFIDETAFHLHGDFLWHKFDLIDVDAGELPLYFGLGARVKFIDGSGDDDVRVGIRFPVGLDYLFESVPFDAFVEVVPILDVAPESDVTLNASIGFRYWFD
jgi:hypothetical protein